MFYLFVKIKIAIIFKKILAILVIKVRNFVMLATLNNLKFNKDNFNVKFCNRNNKEKASLKKSKSKFFLLFYFL